MSRAGTHIDPTAPHRPHGPTSTPRPHSQESSAARCVLRHAGGLGGGVVFRIQVLLECVGQRYGVVPGHLRDQNLGLLWGVLGSTRGSNVGSFWGALGDAVGLFWDPHGTTLGSCRGISGGAVGLLHPEHVGLDQEQLWVLLGCPGRYPRERFGVVLCAAGPGLGGSGGALGFLGGPPGPDLLAFLGTPRAAAAPGPRGVPRRGGGHPGMPAARLIGPPRGRPGQRTRPTSAPFGVPPPVSGPPLRDTPAAALGSRRGAAVAPPPRASAPRRPLSRRAVPRRGRPPRPPRRRPRRRCPRSPSAARGGAAPPRNDVSLPGRGPRLPRRLRPSLPGEAAAAWPGPAGRRGRGGGGCCC